MDTFYVRTNTHPRLVLSSLFVDDVLELAKSLTALKSFLRATDACALDYDMTWAIGKSCGRSLPSAVTFKQERLPDNTKAVYLEVTVC